MYFLGIDIGTTAVKVLMIDESGAVCGFGTQSYSLITEKPLFTEQRAQDWQKAVVFSVREATKGVDKAEIKAISTSTQGATMLMVDKNFKPIGNALTWLDGRAVDEEKELREHFGDDFFYRLSGWKLEAALDAAKILWLKHNEKAFANAHMFLSTQEYINYFLTKNPAIDPSNASIRQLYSISEGRWSDEVCEYIGITSKQLPPVLFAGEKVGNLTKEAASELGLCEKTEVFCGAHDQYCACIGGGASGNGDIVLSTGTTWVVNAVCDRLIFTDDFIAPGFHPVKGLYGAMASIVGAGSALDYVRCLGNEVSFETLKAEAEKRQFSAKELFAYPFLSGSGFPHWQKPGADFFGITLAHDKYDMALAVMESAAFEVKIVLERLQANGFAAKQLRVMGGAANGAFQSQLVAYVTGCKTLKTKEKNACALGAAMIAAVSAKAFASFDEAADKCVFCEEVIAKDDVLKNHYREKYEKYKKGWAAVKLFNEL